MSTKSISHYLDGTGIFTLTGSDEYKIFSKVCLYWIKRFNFIYWDKEDTIQELALVYVREAPKITSYSMLLIWVRSRMVDIFRRVGPTARNGKPNKKYMPTSSIRYDISTLDPDKFNTIELEFNFSDPSKSENVESKYIAYVKVCNNHRLTRVEKITFQNIKGGRSSSRLKIVEGKL